MAMNRPLVHTFTLAASAHLTTSHGHLASVMPSNPLRILVPESLRLSTPARSSRFTCRPSTTVSNTSNYSPLCRPRHAHLLCQRNGLGYAHHLASDDDAFVTAMDQFFGGHACQTTVAMDFDHWFTGCINGQCQQLAAAFSGICLMNCTDI